MKKIKLTTIAAVTLLSSVSAPSYSASLDLNNDNALVQLAQYQNVTAIKRQLAKDIASNYSVLNRTLKQQVSQYNLTVAADNLAALGTQKMQSLSTANNAIEQLKGLPKTNDNLLQIRLASDKMLPKWQKGEAPLFAYAPEGDDKSWTEVEAFDQYGNIHYLSAEQRPTQPVFVIELDQEKVRTAGLAVMKSILSANNKTLSALSAQDTLDGDEPISTSVLESIQLNDDEEPWISGSAEVYAVVTGVNPSRDEPVLDIVDLPYLDHDNTTYTPNQVLIHWERYRWEAVDLLLMEQDDNTNYKTLATKLLEIAEQVLASIPNVEVQGYSFIPKLTNELIAQMPDEWFTNNDDYVDVFYTLFEGQQYTQHTGASVNATITLSPLQINPR